MSNSKKSVSLLKTCERGHLQLAKNVKKKKKSRMNKKKNSIIFKSTFYRNLSCWSFKVTKYRINN